MSYRVISVTGGHRLVAIGEDHELCYFDMFSEKLLDTDDTIDTDDIAACKNGFLFLKKKKGTSFRLEVISVDDRHSVGFIDYYNEIDDIINVSTDASIAVFKSMNNIVLWDMTTDRKLKSLDVDKMLLEVFYNDGKRHEIVNALSDDGRYYAYLDPQNLIHVYDTATDESFSIYNNELEFKYNWERSLRFYKYGGEYRLLLSGTFTFKDKKFNLCIFDIANRDLIHCSNVSPTGRVPRVHNIITTTDRYIVLSAMYGFMDNNYIIWLADIEDGKYIEHIQLEDSGSVKDIIDSRCDDFLLVHCGGFYYRGNPFQIVDLNRKEIMKILGEKFV